MALTTSQTFSRTNLREYAFTIDNILREEIDIAFNHSPALAIFAGQTLGDFGPTQMAGMGKRTVTGGESVTVRVTLGEHAGAKWSAGPYGTHNVAPDSNTRISTSNWKFLTHGLTIAEHELLINKGDAAIIDFLGSQTRSTIQAMGNKLSEAIYATTTPPLGITPLNVLISANDEVQTLSGANYVRWNSRGLSARGTAAASVSFMSGSFVAQGISDMRTCFNNASEGIIKPNVILTEHETHERYEGALQPQERFMGAVPVADGSFGALAFRTVPVLADAYCTSGALFMLRVGDTEGIQLQCLSGADFEFGEWKPASNQNVMVRSLATTCQLMIGNRQYGCNKMTGITD